MDIKSNIFCKKLLQVTFEFPGKNLKNENENF